MVLYQHMLNLKLVEWLQFEGLKHLTLSGKERGNSVLQNQFDQSVETSPKYIWMKMSLKYNWLIRVHPSREDSNPVISVIPDLGIFSLDMPKTLKYSSLVFARWNLEPKTISAHHGPVDICISACLTSHPEKLILLVINKLCMIHICSTLTLCHLQVILHADLS